MQALPSGAMRVHFIGVSTVIPGNTSSSSLFLCLLKENSRAATVIHTKTYTLEMVHMEIKINYWLINTNRIEPN